jgi:hypothetical protein
MTRSGLDRGEEAPAGDRASATAVRPGVDMMVTLRQGEGVVPGGARGGEWARGAVCR